MRITRNSRVSWESPFNTSICEPSAGEYGDRSSAPQRLTAMASAGVSMGWPSVPLVNIFTGMRIKTRLARRLSIIACAVAIAAAPPRAPRPQTAAPELLHDQFKVALQAGQGFIISLCFVDKVTLARQDGFASLKCYTCPSGGIGRRASFRS